MTLVLMLSITHQDYGSTLLYGILKKTIGKYQIIQNIYVKLVLNQSKYESSTEALKTIHWIPLQQRIEYKILTTTFKCIKGTASQYLQDLIQIKENR